MKGHYFSLLIVRALFGFSPMISGSVVIQPYPAKGEGYSWHNQAELHLISAGDYEFANANFPEQVMIVVESSGVSIDGKNANIAHIEGKPDLNLRNIHIDTTSENAITECNTIENSNFVSIGIVHGTIKNSNFVSAETVQGTIENANFFSVKTMHGDIENTNFFSVETMHGAIENSNFFSVGTLHSTIENSNFFSVRVVYSTIWNSGFFSVGTKRDVIGNQNESVQLLV